MTDRIGRLLSRHGVRPVKDIRDPLSLCGAYGVPCSYGQLYIRTTKHSVHACIDKHSRYCHLWQLEKSAIVEYALANADHPILFEETRLLLSVSGNFHHLHMESVPVSYTHLDVYKRQQIFWALNKQTLCHL